MKSTPRRATEAWLDVDALALDIAQLCRRVALASDNPDVLEPVVEIIHKAQRIRRAAIARVKAIE